MAFSDAYARGAGGQAPGSALLATVQSLPALRLQSEQARLRKLINDIVEQSLKDERAGAPAAGQNINAFVEQMNAAVSGPQGVLNATRQFGTPGQPIPGAGDGAAASQVQAPTSPAEIFSLSQRHKQEAASAQAQAEATVAAQATLARATGLLGSYLNNSAYVASLPPDEVARQAAVLLDEDTGFKEFVRRNEKTIQNLGGMSRSYLDFPVAKPQQVLPPLSAMFPEGAPAGPPSRQDGIRTIYEPLQSGPPTYLQMQPGVPTPWTGGGLLNPPINTVYEPALVGPPSYLQTQAVTPTPPVGFTPVDPVQMAIEEYNRRYRGRGSFNTNRHN